MGDFDGANYEDGFIAELVTFVAGNSFQSMFEAFFIEHATKFSLDEEHQLHYYEIYQQFHEMFEGQLEEFCNRSNMTETDFMIRCRAAREKDEKAKHYVDILLSSVEYETFVKLMKIMRPLAESRLSTKADAKNKCEERDVVGVKNSSTHRVVAQDKATSLSAKGSQNDEEDDDDPFAPRKSPPRSDTNGKGTASDAKFERISDTKDSDHRK